ncbi:MAG: response regulator, partial [Rubrivivax sp.]
ALGVDALPTFSGQRGLVVDDNEVNLMIAGELLSQAGLEVETAQNGAHALECLERGHFDMVFMDMQMPVMDGLEATRRIRSQPDKARLPIVAMTANVLATDRELCLQAGMDDVLTKPIEPELLLQAVRQYAVTMPG